MIAKKIVVKELVKMSLYYPMTKHTDEEIEVLAEMWLEDFENISNNVFIDACKLHRKASQFMPTGKDILDRCSDVWEERRRNIKQLPEPIPDLTPEQIKENADRVRKIVKEAGKKTKKLGKYSRG